MPSLTIRDIPEGLLARIRANAKRERRSLNSELIRRLELSEQLNSRALTTHDVNARLARMKAFTDSLPFDAEHGTDSIEEALAEGRKA